MGGGGGGGGGGVLGAYVILVSAQVSPSWDRGLNFDFDLALDLDQGLTISPVLKSTRRKVSTYHKSKSFESKCWADTIQCPALEDQCCRYSKLCS